MKHFRLFILAGVLCLSGCSTTPAADPVATINALALPVMHSDVQPAGQNSQSITRCFQDNPGADWQP